MFTKWLKQTKLLLITDGSFINCDIAKYRIIKGLIYKNAYKSALFYFKHIN